MRPLALLDTSVLILLLSEKFDDSPEERETDRRRMAVRDVIADTQKTFQIVIPSVVVAELGRDSSAERELQILVSSLGRFRILPLTRLAGITASKIARIALKSRTRGAERGAVKYDALITGTAIAYAAEQIITENRRDYEKHLASVGAAIEIVMPSQPPATGQVKIFQKRSP